MENDSYKTFSWRYVDLFKGLQLIKDSLDFIDQNRKTIYLMILHFSIRKFYQIKLVM